MDTLTLRCGALLSHPPRSLPGSCSRERSLAAVEALQVLGPAVGSRTLAWLTPRGSHMHHVQLGAGLAGQSHHGPCGPSRPFEAATRQRGPLSGKCSSSRLHSIGSTDRSRLTFANSPIRLDPAAILIHGVLTNHRGTGNARGVEIEEAAQRLTTAAGRRAESAIVPTVAGADQARRGPRAPGWHKCWYSSNSWEMTPVTSTAESEG
jgi:hypothetical protein